MIFWVYKYVIKIFEKKFAKCLLRIFKMFMFASEMFKQPSKPKPFTYETSTFNHRKTLSSDAD